MQTNVALLSFALVLSSISAWARSPSLDLADHSTRSLNFFAVADKSVEKPEDTDLLNREPGARRSIERDADGLFRIDAIVGASTVNFVIDSGATHVFLSQKDAARIGLDKRLGTRGEINTATGTNQIRWVLAPRIHVADQQLNDLQLGIIPGDQSLLGQEAIAQMGRITIDQAILTLENN